VAIGEGFDEVLASARAGDPAALTALYRDVAPLVLGYLRSNRVADADDVAGDVFVSLVQGLDAFSGTEQQFRSWLLTIAHRRMVDNVRRRVRQPEPVAIEATDQEPGHARDQQSPMPLEREVMTNLACRELADAMDELSDLQREAMMLRALADLSVPDIARVMDKPISAVKALLRRATANLAKALDGDGSLVGDRDGDTIVASGRRRRIDSRSASDHSVTARTSGSDGGSRR